MGLLTGFSLISAVEIIYFATKIILKIFQNKMSLYMRDNDRKVNIHSSFPTVVTFIYRRSFLVDSVLVKPV